MSILIKGIEMPKDCIFCPMFNGAWAMCDVLNKTTSAKGRHDDCPLVSVPPHGRLIDADALMARFEKEEKAADEHGRDFSFSFKSGGENCTEWWPVQQMLMDAPTIIEAEEGET